MGKSLLLADDSVTIQKVVGLSFASEDIAITTVDNGDDAITRARETKPDVILADVVMPGLSGYEVCEAVKADPELQHIPVLLLTGTFEAFDEARAEQVGASGHVSKPFEAQTLVDQVQALLDQPAATEAPATPPPVPEVAAAAAEAEAVESPAPDATVVAPAAGNAFDFFDEPAPEPTHAADASLEAATSDGGAFSFNEEELDADSVAADPAPAQAAAHTVAILPDAPPEPEAGAIDSLPPLPSEADAGLDGSTVAVMPEEREIAPLAPEPAPPGDGFDFEFESVHAAPEELDAMPGVAESSLLDPAGDSAFDVSSSELGSLDFDAAEAEPAPPAPPTQLLHTDVDAIAPIAEPVAEAKAEAAMPGLDPDPVMEMLSAPPRADAPPAPFVEEEPTEPPEREDAFDATVAETSEADWPEPAPAVEAEPLAVAPVVDAEPVAVAAAEMMPEEPVVASAAPTVDTEALLEKIGPALSEQLHETLEKIAWESFGSVTETIVEQAVERLEKAAWEVVPKLAETLIQEEIRKLKSGE